ncbi:MAG: nitrilase family protein [Muribaculaceae bacterium]|nr:nitrilase family protein [Muribaculaceae bacterium]
MSASDIRIATVALDIALGERDANLDAAERILERLPAGTDVAVLPELFSTGYTADPDRLRNMAEGSDDATLNRVRLWARRFNMAIAGSYLSLTDDRITNRAFFIEPGGEEVYYDKRHLFCISSESKMLTAGREHCPIIRFRGWNFAMIICYDLRFPVWSRNVGGHYDILLVPANWPESRGYAWEHLLIARAIENQAYVAGANRSGTDEYGTYDNLSFFFDPTGKPTGSIDAASGCLTATFDHERLLELRRRLPVGNDADNFNISDL